MSDENKIPGSGENEDVLKTGAERNIRTVQEEHTGREPGVYIPGAEEQPPQPATGEGRFIKTAGTPFVSVRAEQDAQEHTTEINSYSDRLTTKASAEKRHTGYTGKINTYDAAHAAPAQGGSRMIRPAADEPAPERMPAPAEEPAEAPAEAPAAKEPETKVIRLEGTEDAAPAADEPTRHVRTRGSLLREIADSADDGVRRNPDQLMMEGFEDRAREEEEKRVRREEAAKLEEELGRSREKRISSFKFWGSRDDTGDSEDETFSGVREDTLLPAFLQRIAGRFAGIDNAFAPVNSEEYEDENDRKAVFSTLIAARKNTLVRILIVGVLGVALLILNLVASLSAANHGGFFTAYGGSNAVLISLNLALLAVTAGVMFPDLKNGVISLLKIRPKADTSLVFLLCAALVQLVAAYFSQFKLEFDYHLLTPAAVLLCVPYLFAKLFYLDHTRQCFKSASSKSDKAYLRKVSDPEFAARLRCERTGDDNVVYAGKTRFISNFLSRSADCAFAGMPASRLVLICALIAFIAGVVAWIVNGSFLLCATAVTLTLAFSFPVGCLVVTGWAIAGENKKLSVKSSFVLSYADARDFSAVDNLAADASELIDAEITNCMTAKNVSVRQARFVAASIAAGAGSLIRTIFAEDISNFEEKLPAAENVVYEDRLGLSAWVSGCKVLLGAHAILVNHNVRVPEDAVVRSLLQEGEYPLYLAIEGHFTAVFAVKYKAQAGVGGGLRDLVSRGTNLLLSTTDANVTEEFAERLLDLPDGSVRIVPNAAGAQLADARNTVTDSEDAGIVFTDAMGSLFRCAAAAVRLDKIKKISRLLCSAGAYAFAAVAFVLVVTGVFARLGAIVPAALQAALIGLCFTSPLLTGVRLPAFLDKKKKKDGADPEEEEPFPAPEDAPAYVQETLDSLQGPAEEDGTQPEEVENPAEKIIPKIEPPEPEVKGEVSEETASALESFSPKDEPAPAAPEAEEETGPVTSEKFKKTLSSLGGFLSKFTQTEEEPEETEIDAPARRSEKREGKSGFSLFVKGEERYNVNKTAEDIERDYEERKKTEREIRATFTAPEDPPAPRFDLNKPEKPEPRVTGRFEPPVTAGEIDVFDDALFSRFEDDKIFAGLREEESQKKYDF